MSLFRLLPALLLLAAPAAAPALAEGRDQLEAPVFSEVIVLDMPKGVIETLLRDGENPDFRVIETAGPDQTATNWTRRLTISAFRNRATDGAEASVPRILTASRARCRGEFASREIGTASWGGHRAAGAVSSCTRDDTNGRLRSETAAIWVVEGVRDLYIFRLAEAFPPDDPGNARDTAYWDRVAQILGRGMSFRPNPAAK